MATMLLSFPLFADCIPPTHASLAAVNASCVLRPLLYSSLTLSIYSSLYFVFFLSYPPPPLPRPFTQTTSAPLIVPKHFTKTFAVSFLSLVTRHTAKKKSKTIGFANDSRLLQYVQGLSCQVCIVSRTIQTFLKSLKLMAASSRHVSLIGALKTQNLSPSASNDLETVRSHIRYNIHVPLYMGVYIQRCE